MKEFPISVVTVGPGSQLEDDVLDYLSMPQGMSTFSTPILPEPEDAIQCKEAHRVLRLVLTELKKTSQDELNRCIDLVGLPVNDLKLINQVFGEGEVSAIVSGGNEPNFEIRVQEAVFAGIWRVITSVDGLVTLDVVELGSIPDVLKLTAKSDVSSTVPRWKGALPENVQNAPSILAELEDQWRVWQIGQSAHVINLTLLPMSVEDIGFVDHHLGTGRVLILSRGYGNCRITNTNMPNCWRVIYYNSQDVVILNTIEITDLPEVAKAAKEDLQDSLERLTEVIEWVEGT